MDQLLTYIALTRHCVLFHVAAVLLWNIEWASNEKTVGYINYLPLLKTRLSIGMNILLLLRIQIFLWKYAFWTDIFARIRHIFGAFSHKMWTFTTLLFSVAESGTGGVKQRRPWGGSHTISRYMPHFLTYFHVSFRCILSYTHFRSVEPPWVFQHSWTSIRNSETRPSGSASLSCIF